MTQLPLPLHCYDEAGRIIPPKPLWWFLTLLAKSWLIFIGSMTIRGKESHILAFWYPDKYALYAALAASLPALTAMVLCSLRERLWQHNCRRWVSLFIGLIGVSTFAQLSVYGYHLHTIHYAFDNGIAIGITGLVIGVWYCCTSRHLRYMLNDWRH